MIPPIGRPKAAICDVDGTLADISAIRYYVDLTSDYVKARGEKNFDAFHEASADCHPNEQALEFCRRHHAAGHVVVVVTARMERHYNTTKAWLDKWMPVPYDGPIMREDGLRYADTVIKRRIYDYLSSHYQIVAACDDRPEIVQLWRDLGIPEIEVVPGWVEGCQQ